MNSLDYVSMRDHEAPFVRFMIGAESTLFRFVRMSQNDRQLGAEDNQHGSSSITTKLRTLLQSRIYVSS